MRQRVVTAVIALALLVSAVFLLPVPAVELVLGGVLLAGAWEWSRFLRIGAIAARVGYVALIAALLVLAATVGATHSSAILFAGIAWWIGALIWTYFYPTPIAAAVRWLGGAFVIVPMFVAIVRLLEASPWVLMFMLVVVWVADAGAFFAGRRFGRMKLAPAISPGKTWEGVIGGVAAVAVLAVIVAAVRDLPALELVPFCIAAACLSVVGDLTVSMFKREIGIKDSGSLFPGHGGVLDRIDSIAAAAPLFAIGMSFASGRWSGIQ